MIEKSTYQRSSAAAWTTEASQASTNVHTSELASETTTLGSQEVASSPRDRALVEVPDGIDEAGYIILGELGRGGMGVVYKAIQVALNREVALKMIKGDGFNSEAELLRFQAEAEAVALLDHPHIVPIFEVGQFRHRPFFSMKLIDGEGLDRRLAEFIDSPRFAAKVVKLAAEAVHHAHQRGILHRDLKPANVLLDKRGEPHLTDFGLAKRIGDGGELTHSGSLIGTPAYMAPEQAVHNRGALSTATDVYGLGTILYALLTGRAPFGGTTLLDTLDQVRGQRPELPSTVNPHVPRDLEIICLKCLEKEPSRRYASAKELADDLARWSDGKPIEARPVSTPVHAWMWCRRNPALAGLAVLLMITITAGLAGVTWKWREANRERLKAEAVNQLLTQRLLAQASPEFDPQAKNLTVRELLDRASAQLGGWIGGQPEVEAKVRETIGSAYLALGRYDRAEEHLRRALRLDEEILGVQDRDTLRVTNLLGSLLDESGHHAEAEHMLRSNRETCRVVLGDDDPITLGADERLGSALVALGRLDEAEAILRSNVDARKRVLEPEHPDTLRSTYLLSRLLRRVGKLGDAGKFADQYAHSVQCSRGGNHPDLILALSNQGDVLSDEGKLAQAEPYYQKATAEAHRILGPDHPTTIAAAKAHSTILRALGR